MGCHGMIEPHEVGRHAGMHAPRTLAPARRAEAAVPSVLPPSTTMTSHGGRVQSNTLASAAPMWRDSFWRRGAHEGGGGA